MVVYKEYIKKRFETDESTVVGLVAEIRASVSGAD